MKILRKMGIPGILALLMIFDSSAHAAKIKDLDAGSLMTWRDRIQNEHYSSGRQQGSLPVAFCEKILRTYLERGWIDHEDAWTFLTTKVVPKFSTDGIYIGADLYCE